ncbi:hypothetical protein CJF30_00010643 [Rutstroemia sp. NJR-2017a BBW]|nr:hypothetical protein CJF30_00010643 [Rutstroemia sp. NJR-2017a BBW]
MPHVVSQMGPREWPQQIDRRVTMKTQALNNSLKPPSTSPRRRNTNGTTPSLSLLVTSNNGNYWSSEANRQNLRQFSPDKYTPVSAVDSVFELSSANTAGSPDSVISIAELEDTSPNAVKPLNVTSDVKSPQSPALSIHAAAAIDAINELEAENKRLLGRTLAAENAAKLLEEQNYNLRRKVNYCMEKHRPKTAPSQRTSQHPQKRNVGNSRTTPLSTFNAIMDAKEAEYVPTPVSATPTPLPRRKSSFPSQSPVSPQQTPEITPNKFGPNGFIPSRRPPPIPENTNHFASKNQNPLGVKHVQDNQTEEEIRRSNQRMARASLAEAKSRSKPLPPLGPMSPSAVPGVVEMGDRAANEVSPVAAPQMALRPKKSFAKFFRKGRKE